VTSRDVWVLSENRAWGDGYFESGVWLVSEDEQNAESLIAERLAAEHDDPPDHWYLELTRMTLGVPLSGDEPYLVINHRGERAEHRDSLDTTF
jgi:hypothetical protein